MKTTFSTLALLGLFAVTACNEADAPGEETAAEGGGKADDGKDEGEALEGVADLHLHMFAEEGFGGGWMHGSHDGSADEAMADCDGGVDHARLADDLVPLLSDSACAADLPGLAQRVPLVGAMVAGVGGATGGQFLSEQLGHLPGTEGDTGQHADRTGGFPNFSGFPRWDTIAHHTAWEGHLREAYAAGLRVEVVSAVSYDWLCKAMPEENLSRPECDEMVDVKVQLRQAQDMAKRNADWMEIALSSADARRIVEDGKMAVILGVEATHIFGDGDWRDGLDEIYQMGVRTLQPVHLFDNRFAGVAPHNPLHHVALYTQNCHVDTDCPIGLTDGQPGGVTLGFDLDATCKNVVGLKEEGKELIAEMMDRGMLIDAAHLSEQAMRDLHAMSADAGYYPYFISHAHMREMLLPSKQAEEKTVPWWVAANIKEAGGMLGLRTFPDEVNTYEGTTVPNDCHGSSKSFAQMLAYASDAIGVNVAFGADFNGFIAQTRPRFGPDACTATANTEEAACQARAEEAGTVGQLGTDFDDLGLAHTGLLIDLVDDLDQLGADTTPLKTSANNFVEMWERAEGEREGPAADISDLTEAPIGNVVMNPAHDDRVVACE